MLLSYQDNDDRNKNNKNNKNKEGSAIHAFHNYSVLLYSPIYSACFNHANPAHYMLGIKK